MHRLFFDHKGVTMHGPVKQFPMKVTINTPMHTPRLRGKQAHGPFAMGSLGENLRVRVNRIDGDRIGRIAVALGMTRAEFARWCAVEVAAQLEDHVPEYEVVTDTVMVTVPKQVTRIVFKE